MNSEAKKTKPRGRSKSRRSKSVEAGHFATAEFILAAAGKDSSNRSLIQPAPRLSKSDLNLYKAKRNAPIVTNVSEICLVEFLKIFFFYDQILFQLGTEWFSWRLSWIFFDKFFLEKFLKKFYESVKGNF